MVRVVTLLGLLLLPLSLEAQEAAPRLEAPQKSIDFGEVRWGERVELRATIKNVGFAPLELIKVTPSCACTVAEAPKSIAPGTEGTIKLVFDTTEQPTGVQSFRVVVYSNDLTQREMGIGCTVLNFRGKVSTLYTQTPRAGLVFGEVIQWSESMERTVSVVCKGAGEDGFQAALETPLPPYLQVEVLPPESKMSRTGVRIRARILPSVPLGSLTQKLIFRTNVQAQPTFMVLVTGYAVQRITCVPVMNLQPVERGEGSTEMPILLQRRDKGSGIRVSRVVYDRRLFAVELGESDERQRRYRLRVRKGAPPGPFVSVVHFLLDDPQQKAVTTRVYGYVTPSVVVSPPMALLPTAVSAGDEVGCFRVCLPPGAKLVRISVRPELPLAISQSAEAGATRIELRAQESVRQWPEDVELVLQTSVAGEETISVRLLPRDDPE